MNYKNIIEIRNLSTNDLNKAMYDQSNISLILNTVLSEVTVPSKWYECARLIMQGVDHLIKHEDCGVFVLQKAAIMLVDLKGRVGIELNVRTGSDFKVLNQFASAKNDKDLEEFRIQGIVESLFRNHVRFAAKSFGVCRDYLKLYETAWEAWIRLILNCESFKDPDRYEYMVTKAYEKGFPEECIASGKSPARLTGLLVRACDVQKDSVIEVNNHVRYYVQDRVTDEEGVRLYCVIDPREIPSDGIMLKRKNDQQKTEGWLQCGSDEVMLIGQNNEVAVMNERITPNDIRRGDIVSIYGNGYIMIEERSDGVFVFESGDGKQMTMKRQEVIFNDNIVITSNLKVAAKGEKQAIIYRDKFVELHPGDVIEYIHNWSSPAVEGQVVFSTSHGAYGVMNGHMFVPLCLLHQIKKIK